MNYVHLHVHTEYSLLDGALRVKDMVNKTKEYGMPAVAMTDHGVLYGIIDFYKKARKKGIKPIPGCEVYLTPGSRFEKKSRKRYHLVLLAMDNRGYRNLVKIVSKAWLEGFYYKPRVDKELLYQYHEGLIALSSCIQGEIPSLLLDGNLKKAEEKAKEYRQIFGRENFFLELQNHNLPEEKQVNGKLIRLGNKLEIPLVVTNDTHYLNKEDASLHDVLLALQTGKTVADEDRMTFPNDEFYFKTPDEMKRLFPQLDNAYKNTLEIAERCEVKLDFNTFYLPDYPDLEGEDNAVTLLRKKCQKGLKEKGLADNNQARERLEYELNIIEEMGYVAYFLIVWDFVDYAERNGIRVGPGRGSAAGSLVSYLLGITKVNPLKYNLIFERFLNPERVTMPDIDIDFDEERDKIIEYVKKRYGDDKVAQIGTFGTMAARAAIRDVGRALDLPLHRVDKIAKMIPGRPGVSIDEALVNNKDLKSLYNQDNEIKELIDYARGVEGLPRHISTHAAGVIIGPKDLTDIIPLQLQDEGIITQLPMGDLEDLGLLKMDFLGLRNLTIINKTLELVKRRHGQELDIDNIPLDDAEVYQLLQEGKTLGVFQMESHLFQDLNRKLKPNRFSDLIALLALGRPGPLGSNLVEDYIACRHGEREPEYLHPSLEPVLDETFGLILYQEQVMEIASKLAGYTMGEADLLRRGMGKKKKELIVNEREKFVKGAKERDIPEETAHAIFDQMEYFAGYGFNKSHSTAYAFLAYQTAYLKVKYPAEFMSALLSTVMNNHDKVAQYIRECKEMGIDVLPPDVNESDFEFIPIAEDKIRFGLKAIKNVGSGTIEAIIEERKNNPFQSLEDFLQRINLRKINTQVIESLIKSGAFDSFPHNRSQMLVKYEEIYEKASNSRKEHSAGQTSFFDLVEDKEEFYNDKIEYPDLKEISIEEKLAQEKEYLGIYLTAHPLDRFTEKINYFTNWQIKGSASGKKGATVAGMVVAKKEHITKRNSQMAFLTLENWSGKIEVVVFPNIYKKSRGIIDIGKGLFIQGERDGENIIARRIIDLERNFVVIEIQKEADIKRIQQICQTSAGDDPLFLKINHLDKDYLVLTSSKYWLDLTDSLQETLHETFTANKTHIYS